MTDLARRLPRDMESFFERFWNDPNVAGWTPGRSDDLASWTPGVDVVEEADAYVFPSIFRAFRRRTSRSPSRTTS